MTLTEFLLARIAEDEALWTMARDAELVFVAGPRASRAVPPMDLSMRMLAECEAKRRIVELAVDASGRWMAGIPRYMRGALCALALPYADHPDYREEWRP